MKQSKSLRFNGFFALIVCSSMIALLGNCRQQSHQSARRVATAAGVGDGSVKDHTIVITTYHDLQHELRLAGEQTKIVVTSSSDSTIELRPLPTFPFGDYPDLTPITNAGHGRVGNRLTGRIVADGCYGYGYEAIFEMLFLVKNWSTSTYVGTLDKSWSLAAAGTICIVDSRISSIDDLDGYSSKIASITVGLSVIDDIFFGGSIFDEVSNEQEELSLTNAVGKSVSFENTVNALPQVKTNNQLGSLSLPGTTPLKRKLSQSQNIEIGPSKKIIRTKLQKQAEKPTRTTAPPTADGRSGPSMTAMSRAFKGMSTEELQKLTSLTAGQTLDIKLKKPLQGMFGSKKKAQIKSVTFGFISQGGDAKVISAVFQPNGEELVLRFPLEEASPTLLKDYQRLLAFTEQFRETNNIASMWGMLSLPGSNLPVHVMPKFWGNLSDHLTVSKKADGSLPPTLPSQQAIADVFTGIVGLHARDIIHRDLKLDNILVDGEGRLYLADFDNSRASKEILESDDWPPGTPGFDAPESTQYNKELPIDGGAPFLKKADIYSGSIIAIQLRAAERGWSNLSFRRGDDSFSFERDKKEFSFKEAHGDWLTLSLTLPANRDIVLNRIDKIDGIKEQLFKVDEDMETVLNDPMMLRQRIRMVANSQFTYLFEDLRKIESIFPSPNPYQFSDYLKESGILKKGDPLDELIGKGLNWQPQERPFAEQILAEALKKP